MASLRKRGKNGHFYAIWRDGKGKLRERPTHTTEKRTAQKLADEWEKASRLNTHERTAEGLRRVMAELHRELLGREMLRITVREAVERWLKTRHGEVARSTAFVYAHSLGEMVEHLKERADVDLYALSKDDLLSFRDAVGGRRSARTANHRLRIVRMFLKSMKNDGWITENVAEAVKPLKTAPNARNKRRPYTVPELRLLLSTEVPGWSEALTKEWRAMIIRGYYTGQRLGDIARMTVGCEDPHAGQVNMMTHKTGRRVIIEMHPAYVEFVLSQDSSDDPTTPLHALALASLTKNHGRVVTLSEQFADLLIAARLRVKKAGSAGDKTFYPLSFHSLRHTFVSHLQDAGVNRSVVQDMVGHDSAAVNAGYTTLDRETKRSAIAKLPSIVGNG